MSDFNRLSMKRITGKVKVTLVARNKPEKQAPYVTYNRDLDDY